MSLIEAFDTKHCCYFWDMSSICTRRQLGEGKYSILNSQYQLYWKHHFESSKQDVFHKLQCVLAICWYRTLHRRWRWEKFRDSLQDLHSPPLPKKKSHCILLTQIDSIIESLIKTSLRFLKHSSDEVVIISPIRTASIVLQWLYRYRAEYVKRSSKRFGTGNEL